MIASSFKLNVYCVVQRVEALSIPLHLHCFSSSDISNDSRLYRTVRHNIAIYHRYRALCAKEQTYPLKHDVLDNRCLTCFSLNEPESQHQKSLTDFW